MNAATALPKQIERYRQMMGEQRLKIALDMHEMSCKIARVEIRREPEGKAARRVLCRARTSRVAGCVKNRLGYLGGVRANNARTVTSAPVGAATTSNVKGLGSPNIGSALRRRARDLMTALGLVLPLLSGGQTLNVPPRPADAPNGTQFTNIIVAMPAPSAASTERENWIYAQVISGNVPNWLRSLKPINVSAAGHTATYYVLPDYLAIGSDTDYFLEPTTPLLAQRLGDRLGCTLPTRKMVNQIWTNAAFKMKPVPIPYDPSGVMITVPVFAHHNQIVSTQRVAFTNSLPLGSLVSGNKKDLVISTLIYSNLHAGVPKPVVIYGWHYTSGVPIQPLYNGHEETYADYSHGARLVQMNLIVDGAPNTVTNVLTSPSLAALLSDESVAPSSTIPLPRYTVALQRPAILTPPRSQTVAPGTDITLQTLTVSDTPPVYRWLFNGATIPGATNASFTLTNIAGTNAGSYSVIVTNGAGSATSRVAIVRVKTSAFPVLFADDFDTDTSTNWNLFWGAGNNLPDYTVDWAFDYRLTPYTINGVTYLIPPAPNSPDGSTRAVKFTVNNNDATGTIAAVNIYPKNLNVGGNFALKFDLWINYPGNTNGTGTGVAGSTEHAIFGINHLGTNVNWAAPTAPASDGVWFAVDGEGGETVNHRDYRAYLGNLNGTQTELIGTAASGLSASNNTAGLFPALFPASRFETAGAPGKNWVEVELRQTNNIVLWIMDGTVIAQRTNASSFKSGNIMLGFMDTFNSIASPARDAFVLFDNVRVENLAPPLGFGAVTPLPNGDVSLVVTSAFGDNFLIEAATNLTSWQTLTTLVATNPPVTFTDTNAASYPFRFYRARH
jgi:hypothetical protein